MGKVTGGMVAKLRAEIAVQRLAEGCGVELIKVRGKSGRLVGDCLFCGGAKTLTVEPEPNSWSCSGCGLGGSVVEWVQHAEGVSFTHAYELLRQGVAITASGARNGRRPPKLTTRALLPTPFTPDQPNEALLAELVDFYRRVLRERWEPGEYLERRRLASSEMVEVFRVGFSARSLGHCVPDTRRDLGAKLRGQMRSIGVIGPKGHEAYDGSVIFPVLDGSGTVVQLYGRKLGRMLKRGTRLHTWLSTPARPLFNPAALGSSREIVVCGSVIDALSFWCADLRHVVALAGPDSFCDDHVEQLLEHDVKRVLVAFRRDDAGDHAAAAVASKLAAVGVECLRVEFPNGADANDVARDATSPVDELATALRSAAWIAGKPTTKPKSSTTAETPEPARRQPPPAADASTTAADTPAPADKPTSETRDEPAAVVADVDGVAADARDDGPAVSPIPALPLPAVEPELSPDGKERFGERMWRVKNLERNTSFDALRVILTAFGSGAHGPGFHVDHIDLYSARARAGFCKEAAIETGVEEKVLKADIGKVFAAAEAFVEEAIRRAQEPVDPTPTLDPDERAAALELLQDSKLVDRIGADFARAGMVGETTNCLVGYLAAISRLLDRPLAVVVQSTSAAGKSALMDAVLDFVPEEARVSFSAMTGQSLYWCGTACQVDVDVSVERCLDRVRSTEGSQGRPEGQP